MDDRDTFPDDINIRATLETEGNSLHLKLEVELPGHFTCDRCGKPFTRQHRCQDDFFFTFDDSGESFEDQGISTIPREAIELDISQEIRDLVILSLPYQSLCREDCRGLCPYCGVDLNVQKCGCEPSSFDPRWEALANLKNKNK